MSFQHTPQIERRQSAHNAGTFTNRMAAVDTFKSAVIRVRDILRGPGISITGMDSMRHICLYLLARYITIDKADALGVPHTFTWEHILETAQSGIDGSIQNALDLFYHPSEECLVEHFDRLFGTEKFSFDIKHLAKHQEILEIINGVHMEGVDCHMDILGWVYEQHLKTGSSASRDLGQFFTDRVICDYMTSVCKPKFKADGVPESVCDPTMGTGGFLASFIKYYKKTYPDVPVNWAVQQKEIYGCDTDQRVAGVARMNLFMELGGSKTSNLLTHDSLYGDLPRTGFDIILANMPFGVKGIKHAECCERVKALKIRGTKSEPLFLQLMMLSLNPGGRCAVVVPDGMLVNTPKLHTNTRKYLIDNYNLKRIIKMRGKYFMNTSIEPSIMYFENSGTPTTAIEFWDVTRNDDGTLCEKMVLSVPREKLDDAYSLDMRRYQEDTRVIANPRGYPVVKLGDICSVNFGTRITKKDNLGTMYPVYGGGGETFRTDRYNQTGITCKVARFAISEKTMVMLVNGPYWLLDSGFTVTSRDETQMITKYLWYCLLMDKKRLVTLSTGSCQKNITMDAFYSVEYPLPPIPIQEEIVATLDRMYSPGTSELSDTLKMTDRSMDLVLARPDGSSLTPIVEAQQLIRKSAQMVADVKAQMVAIMKSIGSRGFPMEKLGDIASFRNGYAFKSGDFIDSGIPVLKITNIKRGGVSFKRAQYVKQNRKLSKYIVHNGDIVISLTGYPGDVGMNLTGKEWYVNQRVAIVDTTSDKLHKWYLYYYILCSDFKENVINLSTGSAQPNLSTTHIKSLTIPLPPIEIQKNIISRLDTLQSQVTALETLQSQTEENVRFILESYLPTSNTEEPPNERTCEA